MTDPQVRKEGREGRNGKGREGKGGEGKGREGGKGRRGKEPFLSSFLSSFLPSFLPACLPAFLLSFIAGTVSPASDLAFVLIRFLFLLHSEVEFETNGDDELPVVPDSEALMPET
jgi:hypothetical protein